MKISVDKDFRKFKKGDVFNFETLEKFGFLTIVGNNGTGKSSLIQTIRGFKHSLKETSLFADEYKELTKNVTIECNYEKIFVCDSIKDDGSHMMNAYDACAYIDSGGFHTKNMSHGETGVYNIHMFFQKITDKIVKGKTLVVLDELDKGLSLQQQTRYINFIHKLINLGCHILVVTHNVFTILDSIMVYDLEKKKLVSSESYVKEVTGFDIKKP